MGKKRFTSKSYLKVLIVVGLLAVVGGGAGTFATFNAQVTNPGNTFATGTLLLHATPNGGPSTCTSESNSTNTGGDTCTLLFNNVAFANGVTSPATLDLHNAGTLPAADIKFTVASCGIILNSAGNGSSTVHFGTDPTCADLQLAIQETTNSNYNVNRYCAYGVDNGSGACTFDTNHTLDAASSIQTLQTTGPVPATLPAGGDRYYVIEINPHVATDNTLQNRLATFSVTWQIDQG